MITNSVVPMAKALSASTNNEAGIASLYGKAEESELSAQLLDEGIDHCFVTLVEDPLANTPGCNEAGTLKRG